MPTRWWKADLQIATPAWKFSFPAGSSYDLDRKEERERFADAYLACAKARGIDLLAICDHNSYEWIDDMKEAGARNGIAIFPGCEITSGSGADGVHLLIIGDPTKSGRDIDLLLASTLGFDASNPRFLGSGGSRYPNASSRTVEQILDDLPEGYLVVAPHALNDNGIAAQGTVKGTLRWRVLHHTRLAAIDPGDCGAATSDSFADRFRRRELADFPCMQDLAYVSTSDSYSLEQIGKRFTWIRMESPTVEALRQAFLDHEARLLCDWDQRLRKYPEGNPNNVTHAWVEEVALGGVLGNSRTGIAVRLHHGLNVLIGGRGSGKSTIVAALRTLYSGTASLPEKTRVEADEFVSKTFRDASISAKHRLPISQEQQSATWTSGTGSVTRSADDRAFPTSFRARVVNQKELFERVAGDVVKRFSASRSLLGLIDESLDLSVSEVATAGSWARRLQQAQRSWADLAARRIQLLADVSQLPILTARVKELEGQVAAFASPETKVKLVHYRTRKREVDELEQAQIQTDSAIGAGEKAPSQAPGVPGSVPSSLGDYESEYRSLLDGLETILTEFRGNVDEARARARESLGTWRDAIAKTEWHKDFQAAEAFFGQYAAELKARGIDSDAVSGLERELQERQRQVTATEAKVADLREVESLLATAWAEILQLMADRRNTRGSLFNAVQQRSGRLRFELSPFRDTVGWVDRIRELLSVRSDAFLEDIPDLGEWIWDQAEEVRNVRWSLWRQGLIEGKFDSIQQQSKVRASWFQKLAGTDQTIRLRIAVEVPDDAATMKFLRDHTRGDNNSDWQAITEGSPGQRTAAMLGLVLHYGNEPLVLDQPEDDLDSEWITSLLVKELRASRWDRQVIVASHNANVPVNGDAESIVALENADGALRVRTTVVQSGEHEVAIEHIGPIENEAVRRDIQNIMEGGVAAFIRREQRYNTEILQQRV